MRLAKNHFGRQELTQKASQTFFGNISVQENIVKKAQVIVFLIFSDLQKLPISPYSLDI